MKHFETLVRTLHQYRERGLSPDVIRVHPETWSAIMDELPLHTQEPAEGAEPQFMGVPVEWDSAMPFGDVALLNKRALLHMESQHAA